MNMSRGQRCLNAFRSDCFMLALPGPSKIGISVSYAQTITPAQSRVVNVRWDSVGLSVLVQKH